jgi:pyruvate kinase
VNLLFGISSVLGPEWSSLSKLLDECAQIAKDQGAAASGDKIAVTAGLPSQELGTNLFEIHRVP